ncbi:NAC domain-containing protein 2-like [Actinidia eriantha]|uniref:NAC domain-containing protein 2-like n=1 Tax=Actinidia eriantha TaxID=165200 RepID=UPI00258DCB4C|nr:NAC domain-containing protein 2-like [Actinidia eriantha]
MEEDPPTQKSPLNNPINHPIDYDSFEEFMNSDYFDSIDPSTDSFTRDAFKSDVSRDAFKSDVFGDRSMNYDYFDSFPPGYRFKPHDHELIIHYLKKKVLDETLPPNKFLDVNLSNYNPENLTAQLEPHGEKDWYFFTPRDRKYPNGNRPNRSAGDGYWKATTSDKVIKFNGVPVGLKKSLVFYSGKPPNGIKTPWIMQEYKLYQLQESKRAGRNGMRLDNWVLCKIYKNKSKSKDTGSAVNEVQVQHVPPEINVDNQNGEPMPIPMPEMSNVHNQNGELTPLSMPEMSNVDNLNGEPMPIPMPEMSYVEPMPIPMPEMSYVEPMPIPMPEMSYVDNLNGEPMPLPMPNDRTTGTIKLEMS